MRLFFVLVGASFIAAHLALEAAGFGAYVSVLAGQVASPGAALGGLAYVAAWFAAVLGAPICFIAAVLDHVLRRVTGARDVTSP